LPQISNGLARCCALIPLLKKLRLAVVLDAKPQICRRAAEAVGALNKAAARVVAFPYLAVLCVVSAEWAWLNLILVHFNFPTLQKLAPICLVPPDGLEPPTFRLQSGCSTN
jgi:hypothetical protein